jgi:hypothetical protein
VRWHEPDGLPIWEGAMRTARFSEEQMVAREADRNPCPLGRDGHRISLAEHIGRGGSAAVARLARVVPDT